jgi:hypothetical protein
MSTTLYNDYMTLLASKPKEMSEDDKREVNVAKAKYIIAMCDEKEASEKESHTKKIGVWLHKKTEVEKRDDFVGFRTCDECKVNASVPVVSHDVYGEELERCLWCNSTNWVPDR